MQRSKLEREPSQFETVQLRRYEADVANTGRKRVVDTAVKNIGTSAQVRLAHLGDEIDQGYSRANENIEDSKKLSTAVTNEPDVINREELQDSANRVLDNSSENSISNSEEASTGRASSPVDKQKLVEVESVKRSENESYEDEEMDVLVRLAEGTKGLVAGAQELQMNVERLLRLKG